MDLKNRSRLAIPALVAISVLIGGAGGVMINAITASAQTTTPTATTTPAPTGSTGPTLKGTFKSNEDPAHEAKESAEREAQEDSGQMPGPMGGPTQSQ